MLNMKKKNEEVLNYHARCTHFGLRCKKKKPSKLDLCLKQIGFS
jgi:hypothetical protein